MEPSAEQLKHAKEKLAEEFYAILILYIDDHQNTAR